MEWIRGKNLISQFFCVCAHFKWKPVLYGCCCCCSFHKPGTHRSRDRHRRLLVAHQIWYSEQCVLFLLAAHSCQWKENQYEQHDKIVVLDLSSEHVSDVTLFFVFERIDLWSALPVNRWRSMYQNKKKFIGAATEVDRVNDLFFVFD